MRVDMKVLAGQWLVAVVEPALPSCTAPEYGPMQVYTIVLAAVF